MDTKTAMILVGVVLVGGLAAAFFLIKPSTGGNSNDGINISLNNGSSSYSQGGNASNDFSANTTYNWGE